VQVGQHTRIGLPSNPTTGFAWSLDASASTGLDHLDLVDGGFVATNSGLVGAPGRRWWTLTGRSSGRASLHFVYQRAWERNVPPAKTRTIVIDVH
jgi:inhibitor of cysteine peptidase